MYNQNSKKVFSLLTMDDDDELLLNFAAPDTSSVAASKIKTLKFWVVDGKIEENCNLHYKVEPKETTRNRRKSYSSR